MRIVMGELNGVRLLQLMNDSVGKCSHVTAAVAYATRSDPFFEHCLEQRTPVDFYGLLDEDAAVSVPLLRFMLHAGPLAFNPRLIKGHFHSKIIWWHGFGAYIGSASLGRSLSRRLSADWERHSQCKTPGTARRFAVCAPRRSCH